MGSGEHIAIAARFRADEARQTRLPFFWPWLVPAALLVFWLVLLCGADGLLRGGLLLGGVMALIAGSRAVAILAGVFCVAPRHDGRGIASEDDETLPPYTVMVPLYREVEVLDHLLAAMAALRYPRSRLQVLLLVEEDDEPTRQALAARALPHSVRMVVVPAGAPRTKPRACNYALDRFVRDDDGVVVIFDAEDRPDPDQLLRASAAFRQLPENVACLQARLAADGRARGVVGLLWGLEYAAWFGLYLPGLYALGAPVPLGGTSNHFRAGVLRRLRWDAWNVTEDAELGIRLARAGLKTGVIDSTTWEDAPARWGVWLRQRTRWLKGWWVTAATHLADPVSLRDLGLWRWLWMVHLTLGTVMSHLLLPLALLFGGVWLYDRWPLADAARPWTWAGPVLASGLVLLHLFFLTAHALAALLQRGQRLLPVLPLLPVAWLMAAAAGWRAYWQALGMPYFWEKTPHGAAEGMAAVTVAPENGIDASPVCASLTAIEGRAAENHHHPLLNGRFAAGLMLLVVMGVLCVGAYRAAGIGHLAREGELIRYEQRRAGFADLAEASFAPESDWSKAGNGHLEVAFELVETAAAGYDLVVWLKLWDGTWFERTVKVSGTRGPQRINVPFDEGWRSDNPAVRFAPSWLLRVREAGVRLRGLPQDGCEVHLLSMRAVAGKTLPLRASLVEAPPQAAVNDIWELRFDVNRQQGNPFAMEEIDLRCVAEGPGGERVEVPCFFTLDHRLSAGEGDAEQSRPYGAPRWGARLSPERSGEWRVRIEGHDATGDLQPFTAAFTALPSDLPGTVRTAGEWFERDGRFFYPVTLNLRSPQDELVAQVMPQLPQPRADAGTGALIPWIERCADNGFNWLRLWTMPSSLGLEWSAGWNGYHGCNRYNLANASRIDALLNTARRRRITLELALWQHGPWQREVDAQWSDNPWNTDNGGSLAAPTDVLRDAQARAGQRNLLRYVAARWGSDAALAAWTLWIEIDGVVEQDTAAWHEEMAAELRRYDSRQHMVSTEFRSAVGDADTFALPGIGFTQVAAYDAGGLVRTFRQRAASLAKYGKPLLIEEYGGHSTGGAAPWLAQQIHDGPWVAWLLDFAASPMPWWWSFIFEKRLDRHFARFAEFIRGEDLSVGPWRLAAGSIAGAPGLEVLWRVGKDRAYGWVYRSDLADMPPHARGRQNWWTYARQVSRDFDRNRNEWDPLAETPGAQFDYGDITLDLAVPGVSPGRWSYELWDTWSGGPPQRGSVEVAAGGALLRLPQPRRDFAVKLVRECQDGGAAQATGRP